MNNFLDIVKYLVYGMIVYVLFSYVPQNKLPLADVLVITIVIMMTYMLLDFITPNNNIEKLDPDYIGEPKDFNAESNDSEFSNLGSIDSIGNIEDMKVNGEKNTNVFKFNDVGKKDSSEMVAEILVNTGLSSSEIDEMLKLCKDNKSECSQRLNKLKDDGILDDTELNMLVSKLIKNESEFDIAANSLDIEVEKIEEIKQLCKTDVVNCKKAISSLDITDEEMENLTKLISNQYESLSILDNYPVSKTFKEEMQSICTSDNVKCNEMINSSEELSEKEKGELIQLFASKRKLIEDKQNKEKEIENKQIVNSLKMLMPESDISERELINIDKVCKNKDQCINKLNELVITGTLNAEQKLRLTIMYGLEEFSSLEKLYKNNTLDESQIIELGKVCTKNMPFSMCNTVLQKYIEAGILNQEQADLLVSNVKSYQNNPIDSNQMINEMLGTGSITTSEASKIHSSCSLKNSQTCIQALKMLQANNKISETEMKEILKSYNIDTVQIDNKDFGSISNESELGSMTNSNRLSSIKDAYGSSDMKYTQLDPDMHKPLGEFSKDFTNNFEYGYAYLNTSKWRVPMYKPPVCKTDDNCKVCPSTTQGYPVDVKEWNRSRKIMPPDNINLDYLNKLNEGN